MKWNSISIHKLWTAVTSTPDEPHPPSQPEVVDRNRTFIELKWEPPTNDGGSPITGYDIERKDPKSSRWVKINKVPLQVSFFFVCVRACMFVCVCACACFFVCSFFWGWGVGSGGSALFWFPFMFITPTWSMVLNRHAPIQKDWFLLFLITATFWNCACSNLIAE